MARTRRTDRPSTCQRVHKRRLAPGPRRSIHLTLPADVADRLERIAVERRTSPAVVVSDLVERCPIRPGGSVEPAAGGGDAG